MKKHSSVTEEEHLETLALSTTNAFGSIWSITIHTILFIGAFIFIIMGSDLNKVLLALTTFVSLEAIYLSIFIKMSCYRQARTLERVEKDMDEIVGDVEDIQKDVDEIVDDVEEIRSKKSKGDPHHRKHTH